MDSTFAIKLVLSFVVGGSWAILVSVAADKFGSKIGGLIAGLPSTLLFGLFFLGWTQNTQAAVTATNVVPAAGIMSNVFLLLYVLLINRGLIIALVGSFLLWGVLATAVILTKVNNFPLFFLAYLVSVVFVYMLMDRWLKIRSVAGAKIRYTPAILTVRGLISGSIVSLAVFLAKIGGPVFGGIFSMFPAMFSSTLIITYYSQGLSFSKAVAKSILVSGIGVVVYSIGVRLTYLSFGLITGSLLSMLLSIVASYFIYQVVLKRLS